MGIDYYTCESCGEAFPDCNTHARCDNCESAYCGQCMNSSLIFWAHEGETFCDTCDNHGSPPAPRDQQLVNFLLDQTGQKEEEVVKAWKKTQRSVPISCGVCGADSCNDARRPVPLKPGEHVRYEYEEPWGCCCHCASPTEKDKWCAACSTKKAKVAEDKE